MRIGIDVRCLIEGRRTGVEEYTLNLLKNLFETDPKNEYVLFLNSFREPKAELEWIARYPNVVLKRFSYPNKLLNFLFWYFRWPKIDLMLGGVDWFFFPNIIFGSVSSQSKMLVTIHDLSYERYPETFSWIRRFWHIFINPKNFCKKAAKIIAVSESSKNDLVSLYGIAREKIQVVASGISSKFAVVDRNQPELVAIKEKYKLPYKFILYFGTIEPRKNLVGIIRAFNQLQESALKNNQAELSKYHLVIAGQKGWLSGKIYEEIEKSKFKEKIAAINSIPNDEKAYIFNLASLFVYPSFFEGFGFPPLEAMRCGVPVIASNNSSLPEIIGKNAIMVDPDRVDEIWKAMREILSDGQLYDHLKEGGLSRSRDFDWQKTAKEFLNVINGQNLL